MEYILGIDQSTSGTKVIVVDKAGRIVGKNTILHSQIYPETGWSQQDGSEIWRNVLTLLKEIPNSLAVPWEQICGLSISNQRETVIIWDKSSGEPLTPAVTWQCQRGKKICQSLQKVAPEVQKKTGLALSPYYSAAKIAWLLENTPGLLQACQKGKALIGTMDAYLLFRLSAGAIFATDISNASRTQLFSLESLAWDEELTKLFKIPIKALPIVKSSDSLFGTTASGLLPKTLPISGVMGDSHAALFGQGCLSMGMVKATYGTGSSIMMNAGFTLPEPPLGISASVGFAFQNQIHYVLEGNVTSSGDTLNWLCHEMELFTDPEEIDCLAELVPDSGGVFLVPAFNGLGAPYFNSSARAAILGLSRGSTRKQIARAALEAIAFQNQAVLAAMGQRIQELRVDGGPTRSRVLMQFQAELIGCPIRVSQDAELSALGAAWMGGLTLGVYGGIDQLLQTKGQGQCFTGILPKEVTDRAKVAWEQAVKQVCFF